MGRLLLRHLPPGRKAVWYLSLSHPDDAEDFCSGSDPTWGGLLRQAPPLRPLRELSHALKDLWECLPGVDFAGLALPLGEFLASRWLARATWEFAEETPPGGQPIDVTVWAAPPDLALLNRIREAVLLDPVTASDEQLVGRGDVVLVGVTAHKVRDPDLAQALRFIISAEGKWVSSRTLKRVVPSLNERPDKQMKKMPAPLRPHFEGKPGQGYRFVPSP